MKILKLTVVLFFLSSSMAVIAANNECSEFKSERFSSELVEKVNSFDELTIFRKFPKFQMIHSVDSIESQLRETSLGFGNIIVNCRCKQFIFFTINTYDKNSLWAGVEGFYRLKDKKYFSGPFTMKNLTIVIQADPSSVLLKKAPNKDPNNKGAY